MSKQSRIKKRASTTPDPDAGRYVRWRNNTGRLLEPITVDGVTITDWTPARTVTLSPAATKAAEAAGLTRVGLAAP